jgi:hypothetical protein
MREFPPEQSGIQNTMQSTAINTTIPRLFPATPWPLQPFDFHTPTRVMFGPGTVQRRGELACERGATRALLVTDPGLKAAGHPQRAQRSLQEAGLEVLVFDDVEENPTSSAPISPGRAASTSSFRSAAAAPWTAPRESTSS